MAATFVSPQGYPEQESLSTQQLAISADPACELQLLPSQKFVDSSIVTIVTGQVRVEHWARASQHSWSEQLVELHLKSNARVLATKPSKQPEQLPLSEQHVDSSSDPLPWSHELPTHNVSKGESTLTIVVAGQVNVAHVARALQHSWFEQEFDAHKKLAARSLVSTISSGQECPSQLSLATQHFLSSAELVESQALPAHSKSFASDLLIFVADGHENELHVARSVQHSLSAQESELHKNELARFDVATMALGQRCPEQSSLSTQQASSSASSQATFAQYAATRGAFVLPEGQVYEPQLPLLSQQLASAHTSASHSSGTAFTTDDDGLQTIVSQVPRSAQHNCASTDPQVKSAQLREPALLTLTVLSAH